MDCWPENCILDPKLGHEKGRQHFDASALLQPRYVSQRPLLAANFLSNTVTQKVISPTSATALIAGATYRLNRESLKFS